MAELRWILLLAGLVFLLSLATWELRRAQRARRAGGAGTDLDEPAADEPVRERRAAARLERRREPTLDLNPLGAHAGPRSAEVAAAPVPHAPEPLRVSADPDGSEATAPTAASSVSGTAGAPDASVGPALAFVGSNPIEASPPPRVDWPDERERHIITVRIMAPAGERLAGRAVRQALGACGFAHGQYRIYHQPGTDGRALLSCANLMKPGDFDPLTLDFQRLTGLSLFVLLPGPMPPPAALEHLLATADELAQRLRGELTDERGAPLNEARVAALRDMVQQWIAAPGEPEPPSRPGPNGRPGAESTRGA